MKVETETETETVGEEPRWLYWDEEDKVPPPALRAFYAGLTPNVTSACEAARKSLRDNFVDNMLKVHAALAGDGQFKKWCELAGFNYHTAKSAVYRAEAKAHRASENATHTRPLGGGGEAKRFTIAIGTGDEAREIQARLRRIAVRAEKSETDWKAALLILLNFYETHQPEVDGED